VSDLTGRVAVVTGVSHANSIGFATAKALGERGAALVVLDVSDLVHGAGAALSDLGFTVHAATVDLTDAAAVNEVIGDARSALGPIDILVNNAGLAPAGQEKRPAASLADTLEENWDYGVAINLKTQFNCCKAVLPDMLSRGWGRIVNISSSTGPVTALKGVTPYCAAKAGVLGLTKGLALEVAEEGILVNAVGPGWVDTGGLTPRGYAAAEAVPMGRAARPEEIAKLVAFLASDDNGYVTGQLIVIDGGNSIDEYRGPRELELTLD